MRLGFALPQFGSLAGADSLGAVARRAEELDFDGLWVADRILYPLQPSAPYPGGTSLPKAFKTTLDPLDALSFVAGQTARIALGTSVINLPWYNPVVLARRLTTIDVLSGGRLRVGLGLGWSPEEFEAAGVSWERRLSRAKEALRVLKTIWTSEPVEFDGEFFQIPRSYIGPKPVQRPHPPIYVGAFAPRALGWAGEEADGWIGGGPLEMVTAMFETIEASSRAAGRDPGTVELLLGASVAVGDVPTGDRAPFSGTVEQIGADIAAAYVSGVAELIFNVNFDPAVRSLDDLLGRMELLYDLARAAR